MEGAGGIGQLNVRPDHERSVTVTVTIDEGKPLTCSGLLEREPNYLHWNRLSLLGDRRAMLDAMKLTGGRLVEWRLHQRGMPGNEDYINEEFGTAVLRSVGMGSGINIADGSIQKVASLELLEATERIDNKSFNLPLSVTFWFLQRPARWSVYSRLWSRRAELTQKGPWRPVAGTGLRFRLIRVGYLRMEPRRSPERELIEVPAVEIEPSGAWEGTDAFFEAATTLWFTIRVGISFWHRELASTLAEFRTSPSSIQNTWQSEAIDPVMRTEVGQETAMHGTSDRFLQSVCTSLAGRMELHEQLHAAAFGYAESFRSYASENALTTCVEAIERLLVAFELDRGLTRDLVPRKNWSRTAKRLKAVVDEEGWTGPVAVAAKRSLGSSPMLSLQERIERMAKHFVRRRGRGEGWVFKGIGRMIQLRNVIVHGRKVENHQLLFVETVRARALFEQLFVDFLNAHRVVKLSGAAETVLFQHEFLNSAPQAPSSG